MEEDMDLPFTKDFEKLKLNSVHDQNLSQIIFEGSDKLILSKNNILDPLNQPYITFRSTYKSY